MWCAEPCVGGLDTFTLRLSAHAVGAGEAVDAALQQEPLTPARVVEIISALLEHAPEGGAFVWDVAIARPVAQEG